MESEKCKQCDLRKRVAFLENHIFKKQLKLKENSCHPDCPHLASCGQFNTNKKCPF